MSIDTLKPQTANPEAKDWGDDGYDWTQDIPGVDGEIHRTRTPDVPVRRTMGRRMLDKVRRQEPEAISLDGAKDIMFTEMIDPNNLDTHARLVLEQGANRKNEADEAAREAAKREEEAALELRRAQDQLREVTINHPANADLNSPEGHRIRTRHKERIGELGSYVNRMQDRHRDAAAELAKAKTAAYQAGERAKLEEHQQLEQKKQGFGMKPKKVGIFNRGSKKSKAESAPQVEPTAETEDDW